MQRKTSVTLENDVLIWIQSQIKNKRFRSVSHAIEFAIFELMKKDDNRKNTEKGKLT